MTNTMPQADLDAARAAVAEAQEEWEGARRLFAQALFAQALDAASETPAHVVAEYRRAVRLAARDLDVAIATRATIACALRPAPVAS